MSLVLLFKPQGATTQHVIHAMSGGGVAGGAFDVRQKAGVTGTGGAVAGGQAVTVKKASLVMVGGGIGGGTSNVLGTLGRSGGGSTPELIIVNGKLCRHNSDIFYYEI